MTMKTVLCHCVCACGNYCIAGYLHGVQLSRMPSIYHEPVIFMDLLFAT